MTRASHISVAPRDLEALLAAIYALDLDEGAHARALREVWSRPGLGGEHAVCVTRRACPARIVQIERFETGRTEEMRSVFSQMEPAISREMTLRMIRGRPIFALATSLPGSARGMQVSRRLGVPDFLGLMAPTNTGFSVVLGAPVPSGPATETVGSEVLQGLSEHLAASWRLRKRLAAPDAFGENAEGIFQPDGRVTDAFGPAREKTARERLRQLVLARERALRAVDVRLWPALLDGRYTIIDRFEGSGARYVVAYRNPRTATFLIRLTPMERRVVEATTAGTMQKVIALDLGMREAHVSSVLRGALRKLGLASAIELTLLASSSAFVTLDDEVLGPNIVSAFALRGVAADALLELTPSERAVTADLLRGLGNREIGARRNRSERTVANQVASILEKMRAQTRRALVARLIRT
jgi:DNA-binding NarL/FixJ family response regulator